MTLMMTKIMDNLLGIQGEEPVVRLEIDVDLLHRAVDPVPGHWEARLAAAGEDLVRGHLEGH